MRARSKFAWPAIRDSPPQRAADRSFRLVIAEAVAIAKRIGVVRNAIRLPRVQAPCLSDGTVRMVTAVYCLGVVDCIRAQRAPTAPKRPDIAVPPLPEWDRAGFGGSPPPRL